MAGWEPTRVKLQLRLTAQRLGQLQDKLEAQAQITRRDIATLLQQGNVALARAKAHKLINEDASGDLLQTLEMHVGVVLGHLNEFERSEPPSPVLVEAASSIIHATPQTQSRDLQVVRDLLIHRLGPDFARSAAGNRDHYVSSRVLRALSAPPPSAARLDQYLFNIARAHSVHWMPDIQPHEKVNALSEMLDPSTTPVIDMTRLRMLCSHGLPEYPSWLRPRIWRLLLGTLPVEKSSWGDETRKNRESYYDLVRRLLEPFSSLAPPASPLGPLDASLMDVSNELSQVPSNLLGGLQEDPEALALCPLDSTASEDIKISCAENLTSRLRVLREAESADASDDVTPEIRLEGTPEIRLENPEDNPGVKTTAEAPGEKDGASTPVTPGLSTPGSPTSSNSGPHTTLLASRAYSAMGTHQKHASALLRLLYIHYCLNPANRSPQIASLLVPIYSALNEEVDVQDLAHVEADTFWVFEAMIGEFAELEDEGNGNLWTRKLGERLEWADPELAANLQTQGLDPALPHYSYRWLITLLTHTLPLPGVLMVWDALFSRPTRERDANPKLDYLTDICTSMLLCAKSALLQLGKRRIKPDLWSDENAAIRSTSLGARELEDAFAEGMAFLQQYSLEKVGGIENVLQTAYDLTLQREAEANAVNASKTSIGARLRDTMWRGFANQGPALETHVEEDSDAESDEYEEEEHKTDQSVNAGAPTLTARLANTVWRGISNQSAMEPPPSPDPPASPAELVAPPEPEIPPKDVPTTSLPARGRSMLFGYAEKFKESDAAATLAKVSTNWRVKAMDVWSKRASGSHVTESAPPTPPPPPPARFKPSSVDFDMKRRATLQEEKAKVDNRRSSVPTADRSSLYSPPERPAFFRPVRDSIVLPQGQSLLSPISPRSDEVSPVSDTGSIGSASGRKSGPRPLLLNSASLITAGRPTGHSRSPTNSSLSLSTDQQWAEMVRAKNRHSPVHRDSQSSLSSASPADARRSQPRSATRSDRESDGFGSRIVPLRSSPSPAARESRISTIHVKPASPPVQHRRTSGEISQHGSDDSQSAKGWGRVDVPDSPATVPSPPLPHTPDTSVTNTNSGVQVKDSEPQRGSVVLTQSSAELPVKVQEFKLSRSSVFPRMPEDENNSDSSTTEPPSRMPRIKSRRYPPRLASLRARENTKTSTNEFGQKTLAPELPDENDNATTPRATTFEDATVEPTPASASPRPHRRVRKNSGEANSETRTRKVSNDGRDARVRKTSGDGNIRVRKVSGDRDDAKLKRIDSAAVEGDDEGYNELLSAYESEDV
ncbi:regulator of Vps4 activity in the MVB pathway-domain-containing protein [Sparassis latifolia]